jgi:hypothetical protein
MVVRMVTRQHIQFQGIRVNGIHGKIMQTLDVAWYPQEIVVDVCNVIGTRHAPSAKDLVLDMLIIYTHLSLLLRFCHFILFDL